jgi:oligoribonuclease NrnB/cAMP/cGMP phosphodiesterase (DHH superfamily)
MSKSQIFLNDLKDSLMVEYISTRSETEKQTILERYHQRLEDYLTHHPVDSIKVTIDEVITKGRTITTKSHYSSIEFEYGLTFDNSMSPRIDTIYEFMKSLKEGSDTLVNFSFTGACQINSPDSAKLPTFRIYAFPVPLQYTGK